MADHPVPDDSSHYEISLTAGQAFIAFVLLLCSLGAAFAFGILVGRGQLDERLVVRRDPAVITEGEADPGRIVDLGVPEPVPTGTVPREVPPDQSVSIDELAPTPAPGTDFETPAPTPIDPRPPAQQPPAQQPPQQQPAPPPAASPAIAQVLSSTDQRAAEALAARLIDSGFETAYVERVESGGSMVYRVRVRFSSEEAARAAAPRLRAISGTDPWITR